MGFTVTRLLDPGASPVLTRKFVDMSRNWRAASVSHVKGLRVLTRKFDRGSF